MVISTLHDAPKTFFLIEFYIAYSVPQQSFDPIVVCLGVVESVHNAVLSDPLI